MIVFQFLLGLIGRVFLSLPFILSGWMTLTLWEQRETALTTALHRLMTGVLDPGIQACLALLLPWVPFLLILSCFLQFLGALCLCLGYRVRVAAFLLFIVLFVSTPIFHPYWLVTGADQDKELLLFLQHVAIGGGLLTIIAYGATGVTRTLKSNDR